MTPRPASRPTSSTLDSSFSYLSILKYLITAKRASLHAIPPPCSVLGTITPKPKFTMNSFITFGFSNSYLQFALRYGEEYNRRAVSVKSTCRATHDTSLTRYLRGSVGLCRLRQHPKRATFFILGIEIGTEPWWTSCALLSNAGMEQNLYHCPPRRAEKKDGEGGYGRPGVAKGRPFLFVIW
jgi:hypothetical protein